MRKIKAGRLVVYIILTIGALLMIFPFVWMFLSAFKPNADVYVYPPRWFPSKWFFGNFSKVIEMVPFVRYYLNSIIVTTAITLGQTFMSILGAYALSRLKFPGKKIIMTLIIITLIMPFEVGMIPMFIITYKLGWLNSYQGLIVPVLYGGFSIFFLRQFFIAVPKDLEDAAKIDGCGYFRILFSIIVPSSKGPIGTIALFTFLTQWRSYIWPLIVTNSDNMRTLPIGLKFLTEQGVSQYNLMTAAALMAIVPVLIVFVLAEKQIVETTTLTGLKF